jgi:alanine-glyoxylate transaminase / serine-glyoxylate transaminase / serine-pyruvate transaminase
MSSNTPRVAGRHFLQIPGPSPVPDRILRAMAMPVLDHRGPEFQKLGLKVLAGIKTIFKTKSHVVIYPASGTGAWEAALANALSPGDRVLMVETGHFATLWKNMAEKLGLRAEFIETDWRSGIDAGQIETHLKADAAHAIKAVCVVHNETSTGVTSRIDEVRRAIDAAKHPALLMVDTISGLGSADYRHDDWGVDVSVSGSQKGLMLPPGISFNAISDKALAASKQANNRKLYWSWEDMLPINKNGYFPSTPATNMLYALSEALDMMHEEGLDRVFARHQRHAEATRRAVRAWGLDILCRDAKYYSPVLTAVLLPDGHNADHYRKIVLDNFDMSLGSGLGKLAGKVFRIGTIAGCQMGLALAGVPHKKGGTQAAMDYLAEAAKRGHG